MIFVPFVYSIISLLIGIMEGAPTTSPSPTYMLKVPGYADKLQGTIERSLYTKREYFAFRSVYYAEKPNSLTRFLPPTPKATYSSSKTVDATKDNIGCPQRSGPSNELFGVEDCLSMNIFTPHTLANVVIGSRPFPRPVMFWIHGGSFSAGKAAAFGPEKLMEEDIVLVVVQYRLGPLGWLTLGTDGAPGNAGIFDIIEALNWVKNHIHNFGGDSREVTIAGGSAGSGIVTILLLAPQAKGLFRGAIAESMTVLSPTAYISTDDGKNAAKVIATLAGCNSTTSEQDILKCIREIDPLILTKAYFDYSDQERSKGNLGMGGSIPVIQTAGANRVLTDLPRVLFESGRYNKVPVMIGTNKDEGSFPLNIFYNAVLKPLVSNSNFLSYQLVPTLLKIFGETTGMNSNDAASLAKTYTDRYLAEADTKNFTSMIPGLTEMCSVLWLKKPVLETARILTEQGFPVYLYSFEFNGRNSYYDKLWFQPPYVIPRGVAHADELVYLFTDPLFSNFNDTEIKFSKQLVKLWANFVKHGNPTPAAKGNFPPAAGFYHFFSFQFNGRNSYYDKLLFPPPYVIPRGVAYALPTPLFSNFNDAEIKFFNQLVQVWPNFVTHGNPTTETFEIAGSHKFPQFSIENEEYMIIDENWRANANYSKLHLVNGEAM